MPSRFPEADLRWRTWPTTLTPAASSSIGRSHSTRTWHSHAIGWLKVWVGEPEAALQHLAHAIRLSPFDSLMPVIQNAIAFASFFAGDYDKASSVAEQVLREKPDFHATLRYAAASNALGGRLNEARQAMARLRQIDPALRVSNLKEQTPFRRPEDMARYAEGMRKAGLPEG